MENINTEDAAFDNMACSILMNKIKERYTNAYCWLNTQYDGGVRGYSIQTYYFFWGDGIGSNSLSGQSEIAVIKAAYTQIFLENPDKFLEEMTDETK